MWSKAHTKRFVYLLHRWSSIGMAVLMLLWILSGVVMLFVGIPRLHPQERLHAMQPLHGSNSSAGPNCCIDARQALAHSRMPEHVQELTLLRIAGHARYRVHEGDGTLHTIDAHTGQPSAPVDERAVLHSAHAFMPGSTAQVLGRIQDDEPK